MVFIVLVAEKPVHLAKPHVETLWSPTSSAQTCMTPWMRDMAFLILRRFRAGSEELVEDDDDEDDEEDAGACGSPMSSECTFS